MKNVNVKLEQIKNSLTAGMKYNYLRDGYLTPTVFFINNNMDPILEPIPADILATPQGKEALGKVIKKICNNLEVIAAGIIIEAYAKAIDKTIDNKLSDDLLKGRIRVSELDDKQDIIMMIFSTPTKEETVAYYVDPKTKTVKDKLPDDGYIGGIFSKFFEWRKARMN